VGVGLDHRHDDRAARLLPLEALALTAAVAALAAGCGGKASTATTDTTGAPSRGTTTTATIARAAPPALARADARFLRLLAAYDREDEVGATLAARKAASPELHAAAMREAREASRELAAATNVLARAHERANGPPATVRRAWSSVYERLLVNAGSPFDAAYAPMREQRDMTEVAFARRELHGGRAVSAKTIARAVIRTRLADERALRAA
jgi:hypothetical protein